MATKILIAVDGSPQSLNVVRYASLAIGAQKAKIELLHIKSPVPETVMDLTTDGQAQGYDQQLDRWRAEQSGSISGFMDQAKEILVKSGFASQAVTQIIQSRKTGIARDIITRSLEGYAALMIGRNGYGFLADTILGNVTAKIVERAVHLPVVVIGRRPENRKVLIAFDRSRTIRKGIEVFSKLISDAVQQITICHIVRPLGSGTDAGRHLFSPKQENSWLDENTQRIIPRIVEAKKVFSREGFAPDKFYTPILKEKSSRADGIMGEAMSRHIGTIVVGRHGLTEVADFTMGRVPRKLLHMASVQALWIV